MIPSGFTTVAVGRRRGKRAEEGEEPLGAGGMPSRRAQRLVAKGAERPQTQARRAPQDAAEKMPPSEAAPAGRTSKKRGGMKGGSLRAHPRWAGGTWGAAALATADAAWGLGSGRARAHARARAAAADAAVAAATVLQAAARRREAGRADPPALPAAEPSCLAAAVRCIWRRAWSCLFGAPSPSSSSLAVRCAPDPQGGPGRNAAAAPSRRRRQRKAATGLQRGSEQGETSSPAAAGAPPAETSSPAAAGAPPARGPFKQILPVLLEDGPSLRRTAAWWKMHQGSRAGPVADGAPSKWEGQIFVKRAGFRTTALDVTSEDSVGSVKARFKWLNARLLRYSRDLWDDARSLGSHGVRKQETLFLCGRLCGGGREFDGVPECQREGCELIASSAVATMDLNADADIDTLLGALVTDRGCAARVARACVALSGLDPGRQREILAAGGVESALAAMDAHRGDANVQQWGCIALQNVVDRNAAAKTRVAAAGGLAQIVSAMDSHSADAGVQLAACQLLLNLSESADLRPQIKAAGGGDRVRRAMSVPIVGREIRVSGSGLLARLGEPKVPPSSPRPGAAATANEVAQRHAKLCMDASGLIRKGVFGGIALFDGTLEDQVGHMDAAALRAIYGEHVLDDNARTPFSPPNNPTLQCTPEDELFFVVGKDGIDTDKWELKSDARPTHYPGCMVEGRNATPLSELMGAEEATRAGLRDVEGIALRRYSGPMYHVYNKILRDVEAQDHAASANRYPTTIQLIVSGIRKLSAVAKMPEGGAVFRGLSGLALPPEFFANDAQGCAGGVEASFMSTTLSEEVARKYSGVHEGREATIFRLTLGKTSLGADISWLSQFTGEREMLFPPRTHLQVVGEPVRGDDGVSVVTLWPTGNILEMREWSLFLFAKQCVLGNPVAGCLLVGGVCGVRVYHSCC